MDTKQSPTNQGLSFGGSTVCPQISLLFICTPPKRLKLSLAVYSSFAEILVSQLCVHDF